MTCSRYATVGALALLVAVSGNLLGCDITSDTSVFAVRLLNEDSEPIHILPPGEDFAEVNRLDPGVDRFVNLPDAEPGNGVLFRAGANGEVFFFLTCFQGVASPSDADVIYRSSGILECVGWDR